MQLRRGFKQTELGIIPSDWLVVEMKSIAKVIRGASPRPKGDPRYYGGKVPRLMVEDITRDKHWVTPQVDFLTEEGAKLSRLCKRGTIAVVCSGTPSAVGLPAILAVDSCIHDGILGLVGLSANVSTEFVFHKLRSYQHELHASATHGGTFVNLTTFGFSAFKLVLPPTLVEQEAIAEALSDADIWIESLEQLIAKKRQLKQGAVQELLTGKKRLPGFRGQWKLKRLEELGTFIKGSGVTKSQSNSGELPCIRYGEIYTRHADYIRAFYSKISRAVATTATAIKRGDLLFAGSGETKGEIGKCVAFVHDCEAYAGGDIVILRTSAGDPVFLGYLLNTAPFARQKASRGQGDAVVHISASALSSICGHFPEDDEQLAIGRVLLEMDSEITLLESKLVKARQIKQAIMQDLLTGRIRLVERTATTVNMPEAAHA